MSQATLSRWSRAFVAAGAVWFVLATLGTVAGAPRRTVVTLALYGFVFHTIFGKAYSLVPTYFAREIVAPRAPTIQLPVTALGTAGLAAVPLVDADLVGVAGGILWAVGVCTFVATIAWTIRDNPSGSETGTGESKADRRHVDRMANAVVPVALAYLVVGSYGVLARGVPLPSIPSVPPAGVSHLLAAGAATLVFMGVGFRLLPRFTVAHPPRVLVWTVLPAGALGPALLALGVGGAVPLLAGAVLETVAVVGFAAALWWLVLRSDRDRVGFYGVLASGLAGVVAVGLGVTFAVGVPRAEWVAFHYRVNLLGFLGLAIVGVAYQFYPPAVGGFPGASDRTALGSIAAVAGGLGLEGVARPLSVEVLVAAGQWVTLGGALAYAGLLLGLFLDRYGR